MIDWIEVKEHLAPHCFKPKSADLKTILAAIYQKGYSLNQIVDLAKGTISTEALRRKLKEFNIPLRDRGGPNYVGGQKIPPEDFDTLSKSEIAKKYNISLYMVRYYYKKYKDGQPQEVVDMGEAIEQIQTLLTDLDELILKRLGYLFSFLQREEDGNLTPAGVTFKDNTNQLIKDLEKVVDKYLPLLGSEE